MAPVIVLLATLLMIAVERARPGRLWPVVSGWLARAWFISAVQALTVLAFGHSLDAWLVSHRLFDASGSGGVGVLLGYLSVTFVFYFWHRARHENAFLWRFVHQFHHSPQRLEVITSFYKHPVEIVLNSCLTGSILYILCGLNTAQATWTLTLCGLGELFYHWNVKTPRWVGYLIQRPEMHCEHHREGAHRNNYGDLPMWDRMFGTYHNPHVFDGRCGFGEDEKRFGDLLVGKEVVP